MTRHRERIDPEQVLRGRVSLDAPGLCALIREVNPSGRELPRAEQARRYALKHRLQSLLVRRFRDAVDVVVEPGEAAGVVLLRHRTSGAGAAHAVISELDEDARSWVQRQVDVGAASTGADVATAPEPRPAHPDRPGRRAPGERRSSAGERPSRRGDAPSRTDLLFTDSAGADELADAAGVDELLQAGRRAVEEYDYDLGRSFFQRALDRAPAAIEPAAALLELLVDHLGADTDALALAGSLRGDALAEPRVRGRLALAAARSGDRPAALAFVKGLEDEGAAEVFLQLAAGAIGAKEVDTAARDLSEARSRAPSHPQVAALEASLDALRRTAHEPLVRRLVQLVREARFDEAEAAARELRAGGSNAPELRAALAAIDEHARRTRAAALLRDAEQAIGSNDLETARGFLRQAAADGPAEERSRVEGLLAAAEAREREAAEEAAAAAAVRLLDAEDPQHGFVAYLGLAPGVRARARAAAAPGVLAALDALDATGVTGGGGRARAAAAAVLALGRAEAIEQADPEAALELLAPHAKALDGSRAAEALRRRCVAARNDREAAEARDRLRAARALLAPLQEGGGAEALPSALLPRDEAALREARALLSDATLRRLGEEERAAASRLRASVDAVFAQEEILGRAGRLAFRGDVAGARAALDHWQRKARRGAPGEGEDTGALPCSADAIIQAAFNVCVAGEGAAALEAAGLARAFVTAERLPVPDPWGMAMNGWVDAEPWLLDEGRELHLLCSSGGLIFLRVFDLTCTPHVLKRCVALLAPQALQFCAGTVNGEKVVGLGQHGAAICLATRDHRVLGWLPQRPDLTPGPSGPGAFNFKQTVDAICISSDLRTAWFLESPVRGRRLRVYDLDTMAVLRDEKLGERVPRPCPVRGVPGVGLAIADDPPGTLRLCDSAGEPVKGGRFAVRVATFSLAPFPGGGLFALARDSEGAPTRAVHLVLGAPPREVASLPEVPFDQVCATAVDVAAGRVFLLYEPPGEHRQLLALSVEPDTGRAAPLFRTAVPLRSVLVHGADAACPALLVAEEGRFEVIRLGASPPALPVAPEPEPSLVVPLVYTLREPCIQVPGGRPERVAALADQLLRMPEERSRLLKEIQAYDIPEERFDLARAFRCIGEVELSARIENEARRDHPDHPELRVSFASSIANSGAWPLVRDQLAGVDEAMLDDVTARHFAHIHGLALLHGGQHDEAQRVLERGLRRPGPCPLDALLAVARRPDDPAADPPAQRPVRALVRRMAAADACLEAGDAEGAIAQLDTVAVWEAREVQSSARLARAYLRAGRDTEPDRRLRKLFALAMFLETHSELLLDRRELYVRGWWPKETLDGLMPEAAQWVGDLLGKPPTPAPAH